MQSDPKDPICCKVPYCDGVAVPGIISGGSVIPTPGTYSGTPTPAPTLPGVYIKFTESSLLGWMLWITLNQWQMAIVMGIEKQVVMVCGSSGARWNVDFSLDSSVVELLTSDAGV